MDLVDLKNKIKFNTLQESFFIFSYDGDTFLVNQYIDAICKVLGRKKVLITNIDEAYPNPFEDDNSMYIYFIDTLQSTPVDENIIYVCKKTDLEHIAFPLLEDWQVEDYTKQILPGLTEKESKWLCDISHHDIRRITNEAKKINIFKKGDQPGVFQELNNADQYRDLSTLTMFDYSSAIIKKNFDILFEGMTEDIDLDMMAIIPLLIRNFKNILDIQLNPKATPDSLKMNYKQFKAIQYNCGKYSNKQLENIYRFLLSLDYKIKNGYVDVESRMHDSMIFKYVLLNIFTV